MTHWIIPVMITTLVSLTGCEHRQCDYVKNAKGDQICSEDQQSEDQTEQPEPEESAEREEHGTPKNE